MRTKRYDERLTILIESDLKDTFVAACRAGGHGSMTDVLRQMIHEFVEDSRCDGGLENWSPGVDH